MRNTLRLPLMARRPLPLSDSRVWRSGLLMRLLAFNDRVRLIVVPILVGLTPFAAHAGIFEGGLCRAYQQIFDNELIEIIWIVASIGAIAAWLLDDHKSSIKTKVIQVILGVVVLLNLPVIYGLIFNKGSTC